MNRDEILKAWQALEKINSMIKCGYTIEAKEFTIIRCLYHEAKEFTKTCKENEKIEI